MEKLHTNEKKATTYRNEKTIFDIIWSSLSLQNKIYATQSCNNPNMDSNCRNVSRKVIWTLFKDCKIEQ